MDDEFIMISAVSQWAYCPRRCGLIHVEHCFEDNEFTIMGESEHERADQPITRTEKSITVERALPIWSDTRRLTGKADIVEFHPSGKIVPVEYKHGPHVKNYPAELQLCAQAVCLEEMFHCEVTEAALFSSVSRQRAPVSITDILRQQLDQAISEIMQMMDQEELPEAYNDARCDKCSLNHVCMPQTSKQKSWSYYALNLYAPDDAVVFDES